MRKIIPAAIASAVAALMLAVPALATDTSRRISIGSPPAPFSQNKQNEPALAVDQDNTGVLVQGAHDNIDEEACNAADDTTCPFTQDIGVSVLSFSLNGGAWTQPTYSGLSALTCLGSPGSS